MRQTLKDYLASIRHKRVAVVGIGVSNTPLIHLLREAGISVTACDKKEEAQLGPLAVQLREQGVGLCLGETYLDQLDHDLIFRSPGIRPDIPQFSAAIARGSQITSEMEVFFAVCPCRILAVTGSDGKTTTTTLIAEMLKRAGHTVHVGGNIGKPLLAEVAGMQESDYAVLELSSFQLMTLQQSPSVAVLTNLSPNHLDVHSSMEEYREAKTAIYRFQGPEDLAIFNRDNDESFALSGQAPGKCLLFSRNHPLERGVFLRDGLICLSDDTGVHTLFPRSAILIPGAHNVENYLAAIAAVHGLVPPAVMEQTARCFPGVAHRIELVRELAGVRYYNDSIASSPTRTIAGLRSFTEKVILIAGGYDKKIPFAELGEEICQHVKTVVLNGHTANQIRDAIVNAAAYESGKPEILMAENFDAAVKQAHERAVSGDVVLLSPACASFDQFPNFAARGDAFRDMIRAL